MRAPVSTIGRGCLTTTVGLALLSFHSRECLAAVSFDLPSVSMAAATSGPTTGSFTVLVHAAPADLPKQIGAYNLEFNVSGGNLITLGPPSIPASNPLLSDPGPPQNPYFVNFSPNGQTIRVGH